MKTKILSGSILFVLLLCSIVFASDFEGYVYWVKSGTTKTVAWNAVDGAEGYEIYVWQMEESKRFLSGKLVYTNEIAVRWRTVGHYIIYIRPFKTVDNTKIYGEWTNTLDSSVGLVNNVPKAWVLYVSMY